MQIFRAALPFIPLIPLTLAAVASVDKLKNYIHTCTLFKETTEKLKIAPLPHRTGDRIIREPCDLTQSSSMLGPRYVAIGLISAIFLKIFTSANISNTQAFVLSGIAFAICKGLLMRSESLIKSVELINLMTFYANEVPEIRTFNQTVSILLKLPCENSESAFNVLKTCFQKPITATNIQNALKNAALAGKFSAKKEIVSNYLTITIQPLVQTKE